MEQSPSSPTLDEHLLQLRKWLVLSGSMPEWSDVLVTETTRINITEPLSIVVGVLYGLEVYRPRFVELVNRGWRWINLNALGLFSGNLILSVETPSSEPTASTTSVNYSGPIKAVAERGFALDDIIHFL